MRGRQLVVLTILDHLYSFMGIEIIWSCEGWIILNSSLTIGCVPLETQSKVQGVYHGSLCVLGLGLLTFATLCWGFQMLCSASQCCICFFWSWHVLLEKSCSRCCTQFSMCLHSGPWLCDSFLPCSPMPSCRCLSYFCLVFLISRKVGSHYLFCHYWKQNSDNNHFLNV